MLLNQKCPKCGQPSLVPGYGLMGGGCGFYWFCDTDDCDYFHKEQDGIEDQPLPTHRGDA